MRKEQLIEQVQELKQGLEAMQQRLSESEVPRAVLEDFKMTVDHIRLTVWGILSAEKADQYELATTIVRFRLKRTQDMCQQIILDIDASELTVDLPELPPFYKTLKEAHGRLERLYQSGI